MWGGICRSLSELGRHSRLPICFDTGVPLYYPTIRYDITRERYLYLGGRYSCPRSGGCLCFGTSNW